MYWKIAQNQYIMNIPYAQIDVHRNYTNNFTYTQINGTFQDAQCEYHWTIPNTHRMKRIAYTVMNKPMLNNLNTKIRSKLFGDISLINIDNHTRTRKMGNTERTTYISRKYGSWNWRIYLRQWWKTTRTKCRNKFRDLNLVAHNSRASRRPHLQDTCTPTKYIILRSNRTIKLRKRSLTKHRYLNILQDIAPFRTK